jgi:hypothetical protein
MMRIVVMVSLSDFGTNWQDPWFAANEWVDYLERRLSGAYARAEIDVILTQYANQPRYIGINDVTDRSLQAVENFVNKAFETWLKFKSVQSMMKIEEES